MSIEGPVVDRRNQQIVIYLNLDSAEWLATELYPDGFASDIFRACDELREWLAERSDGPGVRVGWSDAGPALEVVEGRR